jgi:hypothetical protein
MRALALRCPTCQSRGGEPCVDLRTMNSQNRRTVGYLHPARQALITEADARQSINVVRLVTGGGNLTSAVNSA